MKILQITNRSPFPPKDGGAIGYYNFTKNYYLSGCDLTLLMMNTAKHYVDVDNLPEEFTKFAKIHSVYLDNRVKPIPAILSLIKNKSYNVSRFISSDFETKLIEILKDNEFDVIHVDSLFLSMYIPVIRKYSKALVMLRCWNVEYVIWERLAQSEKNFIKRAYVNILARQLKDFENEAINLPDLLLPISQIDADHFLQMGCQKPVYVVPGGIDTDRFVPECWDKSLTFFHLGSLDWKPNQQALIWFLDKVWSKIHKKHPHLQFYIAGRNTPDWFHRYEEESVRVVGEVADAADFMNSKTIMIVPLLSGSGMRIKILEGMALAKTIITTKIGAEGIEIENGKDVLIADTPEEFMEAVDFCVGNPEGVKEIGNNARKTAFEKYDNLMLVKKLLAFIESKISKM